MPTFSSTSSISSRSFWWTNFWILSRLATATPTAAKRYFEVAPRTRRLLATCRLIPLSLSLPMWAAPDAVGVAVDPVFHEDEAWRIGAWIMYAGIWWLPGIFIALGLTSVIGRLRAQRFRRRNADLAAELLTTGRLVDAEVTSSPQLSAEALAASRAAVSLTFAFDDGQGARRWVTCLALLPPREVPAEGETRRLVFDPRTPANAKRIFVSPAGDLEPSAFVAVRAA